MSRRTTTRLKNRKIRETGAELIEAGKTFEEASHTVEKLCQERGLYYVHPADEAVLINGVGTEFLEIVEELPDIDILFVPVGAGSEAVLRDYGITSSQTESWGDCRSSPKFSGSS